MSVFIGYPSFMAYQMMKGKKDNNDGFPSIPGTIARYSALGLTNEEMSKNPVWVDKTGNGHDLQMKNFLWGGMSGVGGYKYNFLSNDWGADVNQLSVVLSHKIVIINKRTSIQLVKLIRNELENTINITLKITGLEANGSSFKIYDNVGSSHAQEYNKDGIYQINYTATEGANRIYFYVPGGNMGQLENPITIEQLPLYPGALVFDGVDDYGTCDNFPILIKEKGYTVVALRQYLVEKSTAYLTANGDSISNTSFIFEGNNYKNTWNFGRATTIQASRILATQTSKQYDGVKLNIGTNTEGSNLLQVGKWSKSYSNVAIWELVFLDHDATEEELTKIKDYFVKIYPWLFPNQAWTVTGKTNEDEDRATIANITGNGNDLVLSNFGFAEGSGYGLYAENYSNSRWFINNSITATKKSDTFNVTSINQVAVQIQRIAEPSQSPYTVPSYTIKVTGLTDGQTVNYRVSGGISYPITQDGIYILPGFDFAGMGSWYGFQFNKVQETCDITIEQIPEYEGYLVTDGVDDKILSSSFLFGNDFTVVGEWEFLQEDSNVLAGFNKNYTYFVLYNYISGVNVYVKNDKGTSIRNTKTLKAVTSEGLVYIDFNSEQKVEIADKVEADLPLYIAYNGNNYTKMAFKNLAIYPTVLSKDDCIKAYNYLQTLKAK